MGLGFMGSGLPAISKHVGASSSLRKEPRQLQMSTNVSDWSEAAVFKEI